MTRAKVKAAQERIVATLTAFAPTYARIEIDADGRSRSAELCDYRPGCLEPV